MNNFLKLARKDLPDLYKILFFSRKSSTINSFEKFFTTLNGKISKETNNKKESISFNSYKAYFDQLNQLGLWKDFEILTSKDKVKLRGSVVDSPIKNNNNRKTVIFCHGVTSSKWSLFYCIHLLLQMGYQVVIYDARNHGLSESSYTTLGKIESIDLEDILNWVNDNYHPVKIGFYGFSMGSATLLFWIGQFQDFHPEVSFIICDSPFDDFRTRFSDLLNLKQSEQKKEFSSWKGWFFYAIVSKLLRSPFDISEISPILALPNTLKVKLLLLHGLSDRVIPWESSLRIWEKLSKNPMNKEMVNLYFCKKADHGEFPFFGDFLPGSLFCKKSKKPLPFCFSSLLFSFLEKNF